MASSKPPPNINIHSRLRSSPQHKIHGRKVVSIDTNVNSYDKTDPFAAFNALRKLLATLSNRMGGCHFKMSPEEHKVSMHLMGIVEPFIGLSPSRRTITRQPTEILDSIASHIDSKRDLLSLALCCKRMHDVVIPRHSDYRVIRAKSSSIGVWNHFATHRDLARNVRVLEILDERQAGDCMMVPNGIMVTDTELESTDDELNMHEKQERFVLNALSKMTRLTTFVWSCNHSLVSIEHIWPTLVKCQTLKSIEINDNICFSSTGEANATTRPGRAAVLPELTTVAVRSAKNAYGQSKNPDLTRVMGMLHHCPHLENLTVSYTPPRRSSGTAIPNPRVDDLLLCGRWPFLRALSLTNLSANPDGFHAASSFIFAHPNLEVLHLEVHRLALNNQTLTLPPNALPRLRELKCSKELANAIMSCPVADGTSPRPLESIKGIYLASHASDHAFLNNLKQYAIKRLELNGYNEMDDLKRLVECVPKLSWLDVGKRGTSHVHGHGGGGGKSGSGPIPISSVVEWGDVLSQLPELYAFHGIRLFYEAASNGSASYNHNPGGAEAHASLSAILTNSDRSKIKKNDEISAFLAWKCPKLRRLDYWDENAGKVIVLVREGGGEGIKWEVRRVKA